VRGHMTGCLHVSLVAIDAANGEMFSKNLCTSCVVYSSVTETI